MSTERIRVLIQDRLVHTRSPRRVQANTRAVLAHGMSDVEDECGHTNNTVAQP